MEGVKIMPIKPTEQELRKDFDSGMHWTDIASKYGYKDSKSVRVLADQWGFPKRKKILKPSKEILLNYIENTNLDTNQIAKELGYADNGHFLIRKYLREYNINYDFQGNYLIRKIPFTDKQKSIVFGTLLGDGSLRFNKSSKSSTLVLVHSHKQEEYLNWKVDLLRPFFTHNEPLRREHNGYGQTILLEYASITHPFLSEVRNMLYPNGIKIISKELLKNIDKLALAVWFMDDGSLNKRYGTMSISTNSFTYEEHLILESWFLEKWDIPIKIEKQKQRSGKITYSTRINRSVSHKLIDIISPYIPDCMKYKITFKE